MIEKAWGRLYNKLKNFIDEDGYFYGDCDLIEDDKHFHETFTYNKKTGEFVNRPKALRQLEVNYGWERIEPDGSNIPFDDKVKYVCCVLEDGKVIKTERNVSLDRLQKLKNYFTHYRVMDEYPDPIY